MKTCRICQQNLPFAAFHPRLGSRDGFRNDCRDCNLTQQRAYARRTKERQRARQRAKYEAARERIVEERRAFRAREAERINAARRAQRAADPERFRQQARDRYDRNPTPYKERVRLRAFNRRSVDVDAIIARDGKVCGICFKPVDPLLAEIDHIFPRSRGGSNDLANLQLAHKDCNRKKAASILKQAPQLAIDFQP